MYVFPSQILQFNSSQFSSLCKNVFPYTALKNIVLYNNVQKSVKL